MKRKGKKMMNLRDPNVCRTIIERGNRRLEMFALGGLLRAGSTFFRSAGTLLLPVRTISTECPAYTRTVFS
ncbi:hypothetical protein AMECASPLE_007521 [Ameca splendens]|uniref:Uncharacterized protein n=1 Tax=Ameca splendens TaxID=208324 RepID=A0ABV0XZP9_9TELE